MKETVKELLRPLERGEDAPGGGQWIHLVPAGVRVEKEEVSYDLDAEALDALMAAFDPADPLLVDREHRSVDESGDTTAMGWVRELRLEKNGIWGLCEWTPAGRALVEGRELRMISPCIEIRDGRPSHLISAALTNTPFFRHELTPISCKAGEARGETPAPPGEGRGWGADVAAALEEMILKGTVEAVRKELSRGSADDKNDEGTETERNAEMDKIKELLGLAPDAPDSEAEDAVRALLDARAEGERKAAEAKAEADANKAWEAGASAHFATREGLAALFKADPEGMARVCAELRAKAPAPVCDPSKAKAPPPPAPAASRGAMAALPPAERARYYRDHAAEIDGAE